MCGCEQYTETGREKGRERERERERARRGGRMGGREGKGKFERHATTTTEKEKNTPIIRAQQRAGDKRTLQSLKERGRC